MKIDNKHVVGREWRFGLHLPTGPNGEDFHMVKEVVHLKDGQAVPNIRIISKFKRPVWVLKPQYRTYVDKKEYEKEDRLEMLTTTQSELRNLIAQKVNKPWSKESLPELLVSPYIYGADISSVSILHQELYVKENAHIVKSAYRNATFDTETDTVYGTGEIIIATMTLLPEVHCVIRRDFLPNIPDEEIERRFHAIMEEKIGNEIAEHNLKVTYEIAPDEIGIVERSFKWFHERKPDWMSIWNADFDVSKVLDACKRAGVDPKQILCDPGIPWEYRICRYKRGQTQKVAASGKAKPVSPYDQWHTLFLTASFWIVDAMSSYRLLRLGEQEERSYSLDAILKKELKVRKITHAPADMYVKEKWHQVMQSQYKFEYLAYAAFDALSMALLDARTLDLSKKLPAMAGITSFDQANSQPKRLRDSFFIFALRKGAVLGSMGYTREVAPKEEVPEETGDEEDDDEDGKEDEEQLETLSRRGWTLTLASHLSAPGLPVLVDAPYVRTGIRAFVYDSDAVSSYPSCTQVGNVSKVTTRKEVIKIDNIDESIFRRQNLNLVFGETNAIEYTVTMFNGPTLVNLLQHYDRTKALN